MTDRNLVEPEFVAHLFAPLDGPHAADALRQVGRLWRNCRDQLGMTQPIVEAGLTAELPADPAAEREGALAGLEDPAIQYQAVVRREHDVLNFSFAIAALDAVPRSRPRVADSSPPGWHEFTRWWRKLGGTETGALLGGATVYLAKSPDPGAVDLRAAVPEQDGDAGGWWDRRFELRTFAGWEVTPPGREPARRLVLLAGLDEDAELSRFAWSAGDTALPPLGRYLLHAAKVRYHARVRGDGQELTELRNRTARLLTSADSGGELAAAEAEVITTLAALRTMQRSVDIARSNMTKALPTAVPGDAELSEWLSDQLADDTEFLETTREQAERMRGLGGRQAPAARDSVLVEPAPAAEPSGEPPVEHRVGFGFDVVSYSSRSTPQQRQVQSRLAAMVERVLADMKLPLNRTDRQSAGDGMMVVLPADVPSHVALPALLHGWRAHLVADNAAHPADHIRLRLSVGAGPFTASAIGFSGNAIIEIGRLLDSETLRQAVAEHPDADLVALVADRLHQDVVVEGYPGLDADDFEHASVAVKTFNRPAWLWLGGAPRRRTPGPAPAASVGREVFVIHGRDKRARAAIFNLLRALDLSPLDWEQTVARTGKPAPYRQEVLAAGFAAGSAALVLITPDDVTGGQSDVLVRAGMALALQPDRTILVELGPVGAIPDLDGRETVRLEAGTAEAQRIFLHQVAQRLRIVGYAVDTAGADWLDPTAGADWLDPDLFDGF